MYLPLAQSHLNHQVQIVLWISIVVAKSPVHTIVRVTNLVVEMINDDLRKTGYKRVNVRTDCEPALVAAISSVMQAFPGEAVPEQTAPGDWKAHGPVENAIKMMKGSY